MITLLLNRLPWEMCIVKGIYLLSLMKDIYIMNIKTFITLSLCPLHQYANIGQQVYRGIVDPRAQEVSHIS